MNPTLTRAQQLLAKARQKREEESLAVTDSIDDYAEEVLDGTKQIKTIPASVTNADIIPIKQPKTYSAALEKAIELLGRRVPASVVANATNLSMSYLHEMCQDEHFMGRIVALQTERLEEATNRDNKYNKLEDKLLERLETLAPNIHDPVKAAQVLKIVNGAIRRGAGENNPAEINMQQGVVTLVMPTNLLNMFQNKQHEVVVNDKNEVVAVSGTKLGRMDSTKLLDIAEAELVLQKDAKEELNPEDDYSKMSSDELSDLL